MDLTAINQIARGGFLPTKKLSELSSDHEFKITALRKVTTKYGEKIVVHLNNEFQVFLPKRVSDSIVKNPDFMEQMKGNIDIGKLHITFAEKSLHFYSK